MKRFLRSLVIGSANYIEDHAQYRRAMLLGKLALLSIFIVTLYFFIDTFIIGSSAGYPQYAIVIVVSLISLWLTRLGRFSAAIILLLAVANLVVFYFSIRSPNASANYLFFISNSLGAFALFGYRDRRLAVSFVLISFMLFVVSYTGILGPGAKNPNIYMMINFVFVMIVSVLVIYFTINLNHHSEKLTNEKNLQLQKANAELDRFVYSASHDLRAPLSSMLGLIELAQKTDDQKELDAYLAMMKGRVHHLDEFIKEIIDYSRNARLEIKKQQVNLRQLVEEAACNLKYIDGAELISIHNVIPTDLTLQTDPMRLKIVLNNLLNNAIKYHDKNKEQRYIKIEASPAQKGFAITVADNGMGIPDQHKDKVFNMFYRASDKSKGSGLGLYIVKEALGQMGGCVSLKSQLGEGSAFTFTIPH